MRGPSPTRVLDTITRILERKYNVSITVEVKPHKTQGLKFREPGFVKETVHDT